MHFPRPASFFASEFLKKKHRHGQVQAHLLTSSKINEAVIQSTLAVITGWFL